MRDYAVAVVNEVSVMQLRECSVLTFSVVLFLVGAAGCSDSQDKDSEKKAVIGNLGGVPVIIPEPYVFLYSYDDDPHFMEIDDWQAPERTFESRFRSIGFEVRYPDMAPVKEKKREKTNIYNTQWMRVGITAGEHYPGPEGLTRRKNRTLEMSRESADACGSKCYIYVELPENVYGLTGYTPTGTGVNLEKRRSGYGGGADMRDKNIYFQPGQDGRVVTFIECYNREIKSGRCQQSFDLNPKMDALVSVNYRKALLPHWQDIQSAVTNLVYSFELKNQK